MQPARPPVSVQAGEQPASDEQESGWQGSDQQGSDQQGDPFSERLAVSGLTAEWGTVRREVVVRISAAAAWARIAAADSNASWFPLLDASWLEHDVQSGAVVRKVRNRLGVVLTEDLIVVDHVQRRLQYRIRPIAAFRSHLATIDVIELESPSDTDPGRCLIVYGTDVSPRPLSLVFGAATADALETLRSQLESAAAAAECTSEE